MKKIEFKISTESGRLDKYLSKKMSDYSRSTIQKWIKNQQVFVNQDVSRANYLIQEGDEIIVEIPDVVEGTIEAENLPLNIIYQDKDLAVINKEQGIVVHPALGNESKTLVNALMYHLDSLSGINGEIRPGIVHRLDKDTSGALVVAKNDLAHQKLTQQLQDRSMERTYWAIVHGQLQHTNGTIDAPIGREPNHRQKFAVVSDGKPSVSHFKIIEHFNDFTLLEVKLETGRTHQIRVHLNYIGHPVAGDPAYGPSKTLKGDGQFLHARQLSFVHPSQNKNMSFQAELPENFQLALKELRDGKTNH